MLMQLYDSLEDSYSVREQYDKLITMLKEEYEATPDESIQQWYQQWHERQIKHHTGQLGRKLTLIK